jgi:protein-tyrosine kinase
MSRIHEALKKAEQERAAVQVADSAVSHGEPAGTKTGWESNSSILTAEVAPPVPPREESRTSDYLRFDALKANCAHPQWKPDPNMNVFFNTSLSAHGAEQFRTLRSRLYQIRSAQPLQKLVVTSSVPGEGKTFVTSNLAQAIVRQPDRRVLIIDADLRVSRLHVPLGAPSAPGLTDYLRGDASETDVIQHGQEGNLCFIPGGNEVSDPSELIANGRLKTLLDRMVPVFDWIILDSPPCLPVADATNIADFCDGIILVVRAGSTPSQVAERAAQELQGRNVVGVVLNAVEEAHMYGSHYYQGYGYGYVYGRSESKDAKK